MEFNFKANAQLIRFTNGKKEILLESDDGLYQEYPEWEEDVFQKYEKKFQALDKAKKTADEEKVKAFLLQFAKMKQKEPLFKAKRRILEQQQFIDKPISRTWLEIAESGMRNARKNLRDQYGLDYINKKFVKVSQE